MKRKSKVKWTAEQVLAGIKKHVTYLERSDSGEWYVNGPSGWQSEEYDSLESAVRDLCEELEEKALLEAEELERKDQEEYARLCRKYGTYV